MRLLFPTSYLPPISYIAKLLQAEEALIEQHEHYVKQTCRNRTDIYGANGKLSLIIPVHHENLATIPIKEVKISHTQPWKKIHWRSIESAYRNSPYFEYYEDELKLLFEKDYEYLFEWNNDLLDAVLRILGAEKKIAFTDNYQKEYTDTVDLRNAFDPVKNAAPVDRNMQYTQVFSSRSGFIPNLSIADLIFNEGPRALDRLKQMPA